MSSIPVAAARQYRRHAALVLAGVAIVAGALLPALVSPYWLRILTSMFMYAALAQALNVIVGFAGYHAFGNVSWFGSGAYIASSLILSGFGLPAALLAGTLGSGLLAFVIGWPLLRLTGHYFAIATVVLSLAAIEITLNLHGITGGAAGVTLPISELSPAEFYNQVAYMMYGVMVFSCVVVWWLSRSRLGYALRALRDSERGAQVMGVNTTLAKMTAWAISGALTGLAGGIWAYWMTFIEPVTAFDVQITVKAYIMMLMGGMGTVAGPILGAFFLEFVSTVIWGQFLKVHMMVLGLLIIVVVMFMPDGFLKYLRHFAARIRRDEP
ncbi:branched-chain amino acid ABC transporter permease [Verticiella sediminum]|uniref:Branched-chain amino acid ABC transporter permease n=1 Tax=Verticiella sediminum TaxID=1247510 RepID=A0A556ACH7_9BURK|nr:branched-chain amino acid ABC transporter permease [Verticiella sediminum]TSH90577.1 branched-chain amino acid ABC transporter permease [Verticiella sediminum]